MHLPKPPVALDVLLDKISLLHQNLAKAPSQLEADLMKRYLQEYYAGWHNWQHGLSAEGQETGERGGPIAELRSRAPQAPFHELAQGSSEPKAAIRETAPVAPPIPSVPSTPPPVSTPPSTPTPPPISVPNASVTGSNPPVAPQAAASTPPAPQQTAPQPPAPQPPAHQPSAHQPRAPQPPAPKPVSPEPTVQEPSTQAPADANPPKTPTEAPVSEAPSTQDYPAAAHRSDAPPSLNDRFAQPDDKQASPVRAPKAESLRKHIDLNERSLFTIKLFNGNSEAYGQAIRQLDEMPDLESALGYVDGTLRTANAWDPDSRAVQHFRDLVEQHFR